MSAISKSELSFRMDRRDEQMERKLRRVDLTEYSE